MEPYAAFISTCLTECRGILLLNVVLPIKWLAQFTRVQVGGREGRTTCAIYKRVVTDIGLTSSNVLDIKCYNTKII